VKPFLETSIEFLNGVGPEKAKLLRAEFGIRTFGDLLQHYPFRYIDRTKFHLINQINSDEADIQLRGRITSAKTIGSGRGQRLVVEFTDGTGVLELVIRKLKRLKHRRSALFPHYRRFITPPKKQNPKG